MKKHTWYKMWARNYTPFISSAFMRVLLKRPSLNIARNKLFLPDGNLHAMYFEQNEIAKITAKYNNFLFKTDIKKYAKWYEEQFIEFYLWSKKVTKRNFKKLSNAELYQLVAALDTRLVDFSEYQFYAFIVLDGIIKRVEEKFKNQPEVLAAITTPYKHTLITKARIELLQMAAKGRARGKNLKNYLDKYAWLTIYDFPDQPLIISELQRQIKSMEKPRAQLKMLQQIQAQGLKEYRNFLRGVKNKKLKKEIEVAHTFSYLKEMRDDYRRRAYFYWQPFWQELARRLGFNIFQTTHLILPELKQALLENKNFKNLVRKRTQRYSHWFDEGKLRVFAGKDSYSVENKIKASSSSVIKGSCACRGKTKGIVKIIYHRGEFDKFNKNDILVTAMTHPEFLPLMKKAKAIVTDEGGITCHAAIVSRELGIPCIIGTKNATRLLKDGDLVEVDANKGIVRKIS